MTRAEAEEHQRRHGFKGIVPVEVTKEVQPVKRDRMTKTERDYGFILEAQKRRNEIRDYRFQGFTLRWIDPSSDELIRYTPDWVVFDIILATGLSGDHYRDNYPTIILGTGPVNLRLIEVKGGWIKGKFERAVERFKHARTVWGAFFAFEMHQKKAGSWTRIH